MDVTKYAKFLTIEINPRAFPAEVVHEGVTYFRTGKVGMTVVGDIPSAEYSKHDDARVWRDADGKVTVD